MKARLMFALEFPLLWDLSREVREGTSDGRDEAIPVSMGRFNDAE